MVESIEYAICKGDIILLEFTINMYCDIALFGICYWQYFIFNILIKSAVFKLNVYWMICIKLFVTPDPDESIFCEVYLALCRGLISFGGFEI